MKKLVALIGTAAICALAVVAFSSAAPKAGNWTAALSSAQEIPKQVVKTPAAHGLFKGTLSGTKLKWTLTFAKLSGQATAAHIHMAAKGKAGAVVVPLCSPCKSGQSGTATVSSAVISAFGKNDLYVNVHTAKNPNGEIRGQVAGGM